MCLIQRCDAMRNPAVNLSGFQAFVNPRFLHGIPDFNVKSAGGILS